MDEDPFKNERNLLNIMEQFLALKNYNKKCKIYTNKNFSQVKFQNFINYENHYLELQLTNDYQTIQVLQHSLPESNDERIIINPSKTLNGYFLQFLKQLEQFSLFYEYMNALDRLCDIVEPPVVTTKENWRIFKLNEKVFIKIIVNPFSPSSVIVNIFGPTNEVELYRSMYNERGKNWNVENDIYNNLLNIFELMYFPKKENKFQVDDENYCNICYSYLLDGHIPMCSCDNTKCDLRFHVVCLKEWFSKLTDEKTFLTVTMGSCPFCKEKLSASFKTLIEEE